jgi:hypothetical protein
MSSTRSRILSDSEYSVRDEDILIVDPFVGIGKHHHFGLDDPITMTMYNQLWIPILDVKTSVVSNGWEMRPNVILLDKIVLYFALLTCAHNPS